MSSPQVRADRVVQLRAGAFVFAALLVLGAVLGVIWEAWSPPGPLGAILPQGIQADETEAFVAGDGRFALLTGVVGLAAGAAVWTLRRVRGPILAVVLAAGGVAGAALTEWIGYLLRGQGHTFSCASATGRCISNLPLTVHMHGLLLVEGLLASLVYSLFVAFAVDDDLGRPDPARAGAAGPGRDGADGPGRDGAGTPDGGGGTPAGGGGTPDGGGGTPAGGSDGPQSVGAQRGPQQSWRDGDAPGPA